MIGTHRLAATAGNPVHRLGFVYVPMGSTLQRDSGRWGFGSR
jgi:hypothetical protein